jgi:hypothetical protein
MEELTEFSTLVSRAVVMELEFSALLNPVAKLPNPLSKTPLVGSGYPSHLRPSKRLLDHGAVWG